MPTLQGMDTKSTPTIASLYDLTLADGLPVQSDGREIRYRTVRLRETTVADERAAQQAAERVVMVDKQHRLLVSDADFRYAMTFRHIDWLECDGNKLYGASLDLNSMGKMSSHDLALIERRIFLMAMAAEVRYGNMTQAQFEGILSGEDDSLLKAASPQFVGQVAAAGANGADAEPGPELLSNFVGQRADGATSINADRAK
ncbi:phage tail assembly protein [Limnohabitans sp.]|uniref:phage tail assembly protein n=1 Tax=Limnohabitans sp. TaxID=1907725 RepID=UPI00286EEB19|nr:phage tail assembly protein [Limnohabitans sp.]